MRLYNDDKRYPWDLFAQNDQGKGIDTRPSVMITLMGIILILLS